MSKKPKRPRDANQLAKFITDRAIGDVDPSQSTQSTQPTKNPANVKAGRMGGLKGGKARAKKLTKEQRSEIAQKAALARWVKK